MAIIIWVRFWSMAMIFICSISKANLKARSETVRSKQPPLKDVAGMFRSFHYAIYATIFNNKDKYPL